MLFEYFSGFGHVAATIVRRKNGFCTGFGTLVVGNGQTAERILRARDHYIQGRSIFVQTFLTGKGLSKQRLEIMERRVHLKNIHYSISDASLAKAFSRFGLVESAYRIVTTRGERRKYGYVSFVDKQSAINCINAGQVSVNGNTVFSSPYTIKNSLKSNSSSSNKRGISEDIACPQQKLPEIVRVSTKETLSSNLILSGFFHDKVEHVQKMALAL